MSSKLNVLSNQQKFVYVYNALNKLMEVSDNSDNQESFTLNMNKITSNLDLYIHNVEVLLRLLKVPCRNLKERFFTFEYVTDKESEYIPNLLNSLCERYPHEWQNENVDCDLALVTF